MSCNCTNGVCTPMCTLAKVAGVLVLVGGLNWGLTGLGMLLGMNLNVVNLLLGMWPTFESVIYVVVGICTLVKIFGCPCKTCKGGAATASTGASM